MVRKSFNFFCLLLLKFVRQLAPYSLSHEIIKSANYINPSNPIMLRLPLLFISFVALSFIAMIQCKNLTNIEHIIVLMLENR